MTDWAFTTSSDQAVQLWLEGLHHEAEVGRVLRKYEGKGPNNIIQVKDEFVTEKGYKVSFDLMEEPSFTSDHTGPTYGRQGGSTLWGNEESPTLRQETVEIDLMRNGVRWTMFSKQLTKQQKWESARHFLSLWMSKALDTLVINKLSGVDFEVPDGSAFGESASANTNIIYGGDATSTDDIDEDDTFGVDCIDRAKEVAISGVNDDTTTYRMRPVVVDGKEYFVMLIHPFQAYDLRKDQDWINGHQYADVRDPKKNSIFSGAMGIWNGVVIQVHQNLLTASNWGPGGNVHGATALFLGAQAGCMAKCKEIDIGRQVDDYTYRKHGPFREGISILWFGGFDKTMFNSKDFATIAVKTAAKSHASGA